MNKEQLQIVTFEQAKRLKEAGFDWSVEKYYLSDKTDSEESPYVFLNGHCVNHTLKKGDIVSDKCQRDETIPAPTVALALKWFRDVIGMLCEVAWNNPNSNESDETYTGLFSKKNNFGCCVTGTHNSYESAESALLDELLTLIEKEK